MWLPERFFFTPGSLLRLCKLLRSAIHEMAGELRERLDHEVAETGGDAAPKLLQALALLTLSPAHERPVQ